jgi:hypothetical protein
MSKAGAMVAMPLISRESKQFRSPARHATQDGHDIGVRAWSATVQRKHVN